MKKKNMFPFYASVEWVYWMAFSAFVFFSAYLAEHGFSSSAVGTVMAAMNIIGVLSAAVMGNISDKIRSPRRVFLICAFGSALFAVCCPIAVQWKILSFPMIFLAYAAFDVFSKPMAGLCDAWIMSVIKRDNTFNYGTVRYFGSVAFAVMCIVYAWAAKKAGTQDIIFYMCSASFLILVVLCFAGRRDEARPEVQETKKVGIRAIRGHYHLIIYLICHCLMNMPMYCSMTFIPFKLIEMTGTTGSLGNVTSLRSFAEIPSLILSVYIIRKLNVRRSLSLVMVGFAAVQILFILARGMTMITVAMIVIGLVNGMFMACQMRYLRSIAPPEAATSAITLCTSVALISAVVGNFVGGILTEHFGTTAYFLFAMASVLLALAIFIISVPIGNKIGKPLPNLETEQ